MDRPNSNGSVYRNVSSDAHINLARQIAAESTVLLQNQNSILPLNLERKQKIAIIGVTAAQPVIHGSGSAAVEAAYIPAPLDSLREAFGVPQGGRCSARGTCIEFYPGADTAEAATLAASSDVAVVFVSAVSGEGNDRANLTLGDKQDALIEAVGNVAHNKTVVVAVTDGAILTPWRETVAAILVPFLPGQEFGHAITDVLLGRTAPSGKLPITFPAIPNQVGFTNTSWAKQVSNYSEGLHVGYRFYSSHNSTPAFPFGFGETYTEFTFSQLELSTCTVRCTVTNTGTRTGTQVAQLYLRFPPSAGEDFVQLKGFEKVQLDAGESVKVSFELNNRSFSIWDVSTHAWVIVNGQFGIQIGGSSADTSLLGSFAMPNFCF